jgi:hypothetical protein
MSNGSSFIDDFLRCWTLDFTLTTENSINAANTNNRQVAIQISIALIYDTRGRVARAPELWVVMVSTVNKPKEIRAGMASMFSQNDTQDKPTIRKLGMYTWII